MAKNICNDRHSAKGEEPAAASRLEACAVMCVIALREVVVRIFSESKLLNQEKILAAGYDEFLKCISKAGDKTYLGSFTKHWCVAQQILDVKILFEQNGEQGRNGIGHKQFWRSEFQFLEHECLTSGVLRDMYADKEWLELFAIMIHDFCFRVHAVVNLAKWEMPMNTRDERCRMRNAITPRYDVFITYRRSDGLNYAQLLYQALDRRGYKCFLDVRDRQDDEYEERIMSALHNAPNYIFLMTEGSLQRLSEEGNSVYNEVHEALGLFKKIIPVAPTGMSRSLYGAELLDEFNCLRALSVSRLETGEFLEESVDKIVQRFPVKARRVRGLILISIFALVIILCCMIVASWPKSHSLIVKPPEKYNAETNVADKTIAPIVKRMKEMRLPSISFQPPATISDAVDYFGAASKDYDRLDIPFDMRGFNIELKMKGDAAQRLNGDEGFGADAENATPVSLVGVPVVPQIMATDISFYEALNLVCESVDYRFEIANGTIVVLPKDMALVELPTQWLDVDDDRLHETVSAWAAYDKERNDGFGFEQKDEDQESSFCSDVKGFLGDHDVKWPPGSRLRYLSSTSHLRVTNYLEEIEKIRALLRKNQILIETQKR